MNKKGYIQLIIIFLLTHGVTTSFSQSQSPFSIDGKVMDLDGKPIESVGVSILDSTGKNVLQVCLTDAHGEFSCQTAKGNYRVKGAYWGKMLFEKEIAVNDHTHLGRIEVASSVDLKEIVVHGDAKPFKADGDKMLFDVKQLSGIEGYTAFDLLKYAPRVIVNNNSVYVGNKIATIFVNSRQLSPSEAESYLRNLDAKDIDKIEILSSHGGTNSADILGGIVNIVTKTNQKGFKGSMKLYAATPRTDYYELRPDLNLFYGTKAWNIYSSYSLAKGKYRQYSETTTNYVDDEVVHKLHSNYDSNKQEHVYKIGSLFQISKRHVLGFEINGIASRPDSSREEGKIYYEDSSASDQGSNTTSYALRSDFYNAVVSYGWQIDSLNSSLNVLANYNDKSLRSQNNINTSYNLLTEKDLLETNITNAASRNYSLKADLQKEWRSGYGFKAGMQVNVSKVDSKLSTSDNDDEQWKHKENLFSGYLGVSRKFSPTIFATLSLRWENTNMHGKGNQSEDDIEKKYNDLFPYLYFSHKVTDKFAYNILYTATIYRPPFSLLNNYANRISDILFDVGNPNLKPEKAHLGELSFSYGNHSSSVSYKYIPNAITEQYTLKDGITYHTNANYGSVSNLAIDYNYNGKITEGWHANFYGALGYSEVPKSYNRKHLLYGNLSWINTFTTKRLGSFKVNMDYNRSIISGNNYYKGNYGCDLSYQLMLMNSDLALRLGVDDIFNTRSNRSSMVVPAINYDVYMKNLSRSVWISMAFGFSTRQEVSTKRIQNQNHIQDRL